MYNRDYNPPIKLKFIRKISVEKQDFDANRKNPDWTTKQVFNPDDILEDVQYLGEMTDNRNNLVAEIKMDNDYDDIAFIIYFDIPKDSFEIV
jgi:hypothetical protein